MPHQPLCRRFLRRSWIEDSEATAAAGLCGLFSLSEPDKHSVVGRPPSGRWHPSKPSPALSLTASATLRLRLSPSPPRLWEGASIDALGHEESTTILPLVPRRHHHFPVVADEWHPVRQVPIGACRGSVYAPSSAGPEQRNTSPVILISRSLSFITLLIAYLLVYQTSGGMRLSRLGLCWLCIGALPSMAQLLRQKTRPEPASLAQVCI